MSFDDGFRDMMPHRILVEAVGSRDEYNRLTYDAPAEYRARVVERLSRVVDNLGAERLATHLVWVAPDSSGLLPVIGPDARVTLPDGTQMPVLRVETFADETGAPHSLPTNLIANPYFATNTTGWSTTFAGSNTIARLTARSKLGNASLLCTYQDTLIFVDYAYGAVVGALTVQTYHFDAWLWVPASWDGGALQLQVAGLTSATVTAVTAYDDDLRDRWQHLHSTVLPDAGDLAGALLRLTAASAPTAGQAVYLDHTAFTTESPVHTGADHHQKLYLGPTGGAE